MQSDTSHLACHQPQYLTHNQIYLRLWLLYRYKCLYQDINVHQTSLNKSSHKQPSLLSCHRSYCVCNRSIHLRDSCQSPSQHNSKVTFATSCLSAAYFSVFTFSFPHLLPPSLGVALSVSSDGHGLLAGNNKLPGRNNRKTHRSGNKTSASNASWCLGATRINMCL